MKGLRPTDRAGLLLFSHEIRRLTKFTLARGNVLVYSFTLDEENGVSSGSLLKAATEVTGGRAVTERNPKKLATAFRDALEEVRARYLLSHTPDANTAPGWRRLEVKVKGGGRISARKGYANATADAGRGAGNGTFPGSPASHLVIP